MKGKKIKGVDQWSKMHGQFDTVSSDPYADEYGNVWVNIEPNPSVHPFLAAMMKRRNGETAQIQ